MRNRIYLLLAALLLCSIQLRAQTLEHLAQSAGSPEQRVNGIVATFSSFAEGRATAEGVLRFNGEGGDDKTIGSFLINLSTGMYIGYVLEIDRLPDPTKLKITIKPMPEETIEVTRNTIFGKLLELKWPNRPSYVPAPPPSYPEPIVINMTDVIKIPLWVKAGTEWGVVGDQIRFAIDRPRPAREFTLDDVDFKLTDFRLIINGEVRSGEREVDGFSGPLPSFYVPGKGLFIISLRSREGHNFQKIGVAEGNKISFSYGGDKYEWVNHDPVIPFGGKWNLWVLLETDYQPPPDLAEAYKLLSKGNCCVFANTDVDYYKKPPPPKK
ncbi:MAG TPA: hypothetical protein VFV58_18030 [Blastocatellia bacterium]|nr:hypothetical protein [Blastocatellia bacterium]